jgi:hypothetical protein
MPPNRDASPGHADDRAVEQGRALCLDARLDDAEGVRRSLPEQTNRDRLKGFEGDISVTNADAAWIEAVVIQAHQAVEAWRNRGNAAA